MTMKRETAATGVILMTLLLFHSTFGQTTCSNGELRLVTPIDNVPSTDTHRVTGTLEICFNNLWGSICVPNPTNWTREDARVACRQLGYLSNGAIPLNGGYYGQSTGPVHLSQDIKCEGDESSLLNCIMNYGGSAGGGTACTHAQDVGIACEVSESPCSTGDVRLSGGHSSNEGRVEICNGEGEYGTICDDHWDSDDAEVVCNQLGYMREGSITLGQSAYGQGIGYISVTHIGCTGTEDNITSCVTDSLSTCSHSEDANVICRVPNPVCVDGDIRLVNGRIPSEGRVEVCYNGVWGSVCHDYWGTADAGVVCSQLGYSSEGAKAIKYADFGESDGPILLDNVQCQGTESYLNECGSNDVGTHNCKHNQDAGVICQDPSFTCTNGHVRLVGGATSGEGRVEICQDNHYGSVCNDDWGHEEAEVVCGQLGYQRKGSIAISGSTYYGSGVGLIYLDDVGCNGKENNLFECPHRGIGRSNCYHHQDAAVICKNTTPSCTDGEVRLVNGSRPNEGRVEVCYSGVWSGVCDNDWTNEDATVVCNKLQYYNNDNVSPAVGVPGGHYPPSAGPTIFSSPQCNGTEYDILSCLKITDIGTGTCHSNEHVGVICPVHTVNGANVRTQFCGNGEIRLVDGGSDDQGRVEVCHNGVWGSVCDGGWGQLEASVVCQQLGYNLTTTRAIPTPRGIFKPGSGPVFLSDVQCYGVENNLMECSGTSIKYQDCPHSNDAGVICMSLPCTDGEIRLADGSKDSEGVLERCHKGEWYGVCGGEEELTREQVGGVCTHLGYSDKNAFIRSGLFSSSHSQTLRMNECIANNDLIGCLKGDGSISTGTQCPIGKVLGVVCQVTEIEMLCSTGDIRLVGGASHTEGRLEVCVGGEWGSVCDDHWDNKGAATVCKQLGYPSSAASGVGGSHFGPGTGGIFLDNIRCQGNESDLFECDSSSLKIHNCDHREDAGVTCQDNIQPTTSTATPSHITVTTTVEVFEESSSSTGGQNDSRNVLGDISTKTLIIAVASLITVCVFIICTTVITVITFKYRRLRLKLKGGVPVPTDILSQKTDSVMGSPPPDI